MSVYLILNKEERGTNRGCERHTGAGGIIWNDLLSWGWTIELCYWKKYLNKKAIIEAFMEQVFQWK